MKTQMTLLILLSLVGMTACGGPVEPLVDSTARYTGTPGCPDCDDPCEVTDGTSSLGVWGLPLDVTPPIVSVKVVVASASDTCARSLSTASMTVLPSEDDWTTSATACSITEPETAQLQIEAQSGSTTLDCRLQ